MWKTRAFHCFNLISNHLRNLLQISKCPNYAVFGVFFCLKTVVTYSFLKNISSLLLCILLKIQLLQPSIHRLFAYFQPLHFAERTCGSAAIGVNMKCGASSERKCRRKSKAHTRTADECLKLCQQQPLCFYWVPKTISTLSQHTPPLGVGPMDLHVYRERITWGCNWNSRGPLCQWLLWRNLVVW